jgi:rhodanese-related sulfurtransferase
MDDKLKDMRFDCKKAEKFFTKMMAYTLGPMELKELAENEHIVIIDVRNKEDFDEGHIPNAVSIPRSELDTRYEELSKDKLHIVYCYNTQCHLAMCACRFLATKDYPCMHLDGGFKTWSEDFRFATVK